MRGFLRAIARNVADANDDPKPFDRTASTASIVAKLKMSIRMSQGIRSDRRSGPELPE